MDNLCGQLHRIFNSFSRHHFTYQEQEIPRNGVYVLFEKGEKAHERDRIVRVGSHTGKGKLRSRLKEHFIKENKDRSIFRKNIGRALLNKRKDGYLAIWNIDLTSKRNRERYGHLKDDLIQDKIEREVSAYIRNNFSFAVFEVEAKTKRLMLESGLIATVSSCGQCGPGRGWLGKHSPKRKIRENGLWQENLIRSKPLSMADIEKIFIMHLQGVS